MTNQLKWLVVLLLMPLFSYSQDKTLWETWLDKSQPDTIRLEAIKNYAWNDYLFSNPDSAYILAQLQYDFAKKTGHYDEVASALNTQASARYLQGESEEAIQLYSRAAAINDSIGNKSGSASNYSNIGNLYTDIGNFKAAATHYFKSLDRFEKENDSTKMAILYNNLGILYDSQKYYDLAIEYHNKSLQIKEALNDPEEIVSSLINIGAAYAMSDSNQIAQSYYDRALTISRSIGYQRGIALCLSNKASFMIEDAMYFEAQKNLHEVRIIYAQIGDEEGRITNLIKLANLHLDWGNTDSALFYSLAAKEGAYHQGKLENKIQSQNILYKIYSEKKHFEKALSAYEEFIYLKDLQQDADEKDESIRLNYQYEYEKQALIDSLEFKKREAIQSAEISEANSKLKVATYQRIGLFGGILIVGLFAFLAYRNYRVKKADNILISQQKKEVEFQRDIAERQRIELDKQHVILQNAHEEIQGSIKYAKRLQDAILPSISAIEHKFSDSFIFYRPKDVVSGDFYWMQETEEGILFAVADCTGHGVPGSMVSVVCANALNRSVKEFGFTSPAAILNKTRDLVVETFSQTQNTETGDVRDGMDISLCKINGTKIEFAGANNHLWQINEQGFTEYKADKQPVGKYEGKKPFENIEIKAQPGDWFYLFTDGYPDQFGGPNNKKFLRKKLKTKLITISNLDGQAQKSNLIKTFEDWKGSSDQIDDICIAGIQIG